MTTRAELGRRGRQVAESEGKEMAEDIINSKDPQIEEFIDNLPDTASGKTARQALEEAFVEGEKLRKYPRRSPWWSEIVVEGRSSSSGNNSPAINKDESNNERQYS